MRKDIQGLRAFAVLSVVIYHVAPLRLPGGFIGVDIFFVISGYLIIGSIQSSLNNQSFSFKTFYHHRLARLAPAYLTVILVTTLVCSLILLPHEFLDYTKSMAASFTYTSNFWFYTKAGYFDGELNLSPLLHTWSLSVEEQFYFVIPALMFILHKRNIDLIKSTAILCIISFLFSAYLTKTNQPMAFYFSPMRFWQFLIGGLAAITSVRLVQSRNIKDATILICLGGLITSCFMLTHDEFPGITAAIPTILTATILILGDERNLTYRLVGNTIAKYIGDISYSLYLWHWPVTIYFTIVYSSDLYWKYKVAVICLSIAFAILTYHTIEDPLRHRLKKAKLKNLTVGYVVICTIMLGSSTGIYQYKETAESQLSKKLGSYLSYKAIEYRSGQCFLPTSSNDFKFYDQKICITHGNSNGDNILLIGDSHAAHWYSGMTHHLKNSNITQATASGCKPTIKPAGKKRCADLMNWFYEQHIPNTKYDHIIISARWKKNDAKELEKTLKYIKPYARKVTVLGPIMEYHVPLPRLLAKDTSGASAFQAGDYKVIKQTDKRIRTTTEGLGVNYVSILNAMCPTTRSCITVTEDITPIQFDYGHLTESGSKEMVDKIIKSLTE